MSVTGAVMSQSPVIHVSVQRVINDRDGLPEDDDIHRWIAATLDVVAATHDQVVKPEYELTVRIVDSKESQQLNSRYRHQNSPTNVLSFPFTAPAPVELPLLGDIVICAPVVKHQAAEQHKALHAHWTHMVVHGVLHLLGYDHIEVADVKIMEALEIKILQQFKINDPYMEYRS